MRNSALAQALVTVGLVAAPCLAAQRPGGVEFGAFASLASFTPRFDLRVGLGGGARIGYFVRPAWEIEIEGGAGRATVEGGGSSTPITLGGVQVLYNFDGAGPTWFVGGGYARPSFHGTPPGDFGDNAVSLGVGGRMFFGRRFALRTDFRGLYTFSSHLPPTRGAGHLLAALAVSYFTLGGTPPDADRDGVPDARDACANTPPGATVDLHGCPSDSDADGHPNGLDRCPNTPTGALVDGNGCTVDSDLDGVYDGLDQCPRTPAGISVDGRGCARDADGDGVDDAHDQCPNTPAGVRVDETGCPRDGDNDGVPDGFDRCPDTPPGVAVDSTGCPRDADGDGVDDTRDQCPNTPPGASVDAIGCQVLFRESEPLVLRGVTFATGRSRLESASYTVLDQVAASLAAHPEVRIEIAGYTDNTGSAAVNTRLSAARALSVRAYLARRGVAPARMRAKGYGPANPVAPNETVEGRALNRRVELHRLF